MRHALIAIACSTVALGACDRSGPRDAARPGTAPASAVAPAATGEARRLFEITEDYYDAYLALNPILASEQGDHRFDDRFGDYVTTAWMADSLAIEQDALARLAAVDPDRLSGEDRLTYDTFKYGREIRIEGFRYPSELLPVQQFSGPYLEFPLLASGRGAHPFRTTQDYDNFLRRMDGFVAWVDHSIENMREGVARGLVQPRVVVERTIPQLTALLVEDPRQSLFWQPMLRLPAGMGVADRRRLLAAYDERLTQRVLPAIRRLRDYLQEDYLPQARATVGWSELPNGPAWYAYLVRYHTTTSMTPAQVHELGLAEVARIRAEMERLGRQLGHAGELRTLLDALRADPAQYFTRPDDLLAGYRALEARVDAAMPLLFARVPKAKFEVRPVEAFRATSEVAASYEPGSADGTRPGIFYVNTHDLPSRPKYAMEALYLHEAVPGHHYQISLAQEAAGLPRVRRFAWDTAYGEGWALYAESLGRDLGLYTDPYSQLGALSAEMWRAVRLVVDTGLHARGWTREQAVEYFLENTALGQPEIVAEVERYVAWPGQALAYKVGQLKIAELRARAQQALGPRFDVRAFHAQVVESGSLPLAVLEAKIARWIESQK